MLGASRGVSGEPQTYGGRLMKSVMRRPAVCLLTDSLADIAAAAVSMTAVVFGLAGHLG